MRRWKQCLFVFMAIFLFWISPARSGDFFIEGKFRETKPGAALETSDTLGGYGIYPGEGKWQILSGATLGTTGPEAISIVLGRVSLAQFENAELFVHMDLTANLNQGGIARSWSGTPCGIGHLVTVNKGRGRDDNCLTVDAVNHKFGTKDLTMLNIKITNTSGSGRYYVMDMYLDPALLGHRDTMVGDWSPTLMQSRPDRKAFLDRLSQWAGQLQDASFNAFGYDKPQNAFADIPSWRTLFPIAPELSNGKFSQSFASGFYDLQFKSGFKAIAFTNYGTGRTHWRTKWSMSTQFDADTQALRSCEQDRQSTMPACQLYGSGITSAPPGPAVPAGPTVPPLPPPAKATVKVVNGSATEVSIYWYNSAATIFYRKLMPGQSYEQPSFIGHKWNAKFADKQPEVNFVVVEKNSTWTLP